MSAVTIIWPQLSWRSSWKRQKKKTLLLRKIDVAKLKNSEVQERFQAFWQNHPDAITEPMPGLTDSWDKLKEAMRTAGRNIPRYQKPLKEEWISNCTWELMSERKQLHQKWPNSASNNTASYQACMDKNREFKMQCPERQKKMAGLPSTESWEGSFSQW